MIPTKDTKSSSSLPSLEGDSSRELLWTVCHDLLNQLAIIRLHAQTTLSPGIGEVTAGPEWARAMSEIDQVTVAAVAALENVLRLERGDPRRANDEAIDFENALNDILTINAAMLRSVACSVVVTREGAGKIVGNWNRAELDRLVSNLLQNVARHAPGATARIHLALEPGWLHFTFADDGHGLPEGLTDFGDFGRRAFLEPFTPGSHHGLGLWIIHRTVATLNGMIEMRRVPGSGLVFEIRLPIET